MVMHQTLSVSIMLCGDAGSSFKTCDVRARAFDDVAMPLHASKMAFGVT